MNNINPIYLTEDGLLYGVKRMASAPARAVGNLFRRNYASDAERTQIANITGNMRALEVQIAKETNPMTRQRLMNQLQIMQSQIDQVNSKTKYGARLDGTYNGLTSLGSQLRAAGNRLFSR